MKKVISLFIFALLLISAMTVSFASQKSDENIKVDYSVEKISEKEVNVKIEIENISNEKITNIELNNIIPSEFKLKNSTETISSLNPGERKSLNYNANYIVSPSKINTKVNKNNKYKKEESKQVNKKQIVKYSKGTSTGDPTRYILYIFGIIVSISIIVFLYKKKIFKHLLKSIISIFLISTLITTNTNRIKAENLANKELQISDKCEINNTPYIFSLNVKYSINLSNKITRGEWIDKLVKSISYKSVEFDRNNKFYDDIDNSKYENSINYAVYYKIIDLNSNDFFPNQPATREFIADTVIKALGFKEDKDIECKDSNMINNKKTAYLAVSLKVIDLDNGYFYPNKYANSNLVEKAISFVNEVKKSETVGKTEKK